MMDKTLYILPNVDVPGKKKKKNVVRLSFYFCHSVSNGNSYIQICIYILGMGSLTRELSFLEALAIKCLNPFFGLGN